MLSSYDKRMRPHETEDAVDTVKHQLYVNRIVDFVSCFSYNIEFFLIFFLSFFLQNVMPSIKFLKLERKKLQAKF